MNSVKEFYIEITNFSIITFRSIAKASNEYYLIIMRIKMPGNYGFLTHLTVQKLKVQYILRENKTISSIFLSHCWPVIVQIINSFDYFCSKLLLVTKNCAFPLTLRTEINKLAPWDNLRQLKRLGKFFILPDFLGVEQKNCQIIQKQ